MSRTPRSVPSRARRNKVLKQAKGMRGRRKNNITTANAAVDKSLQHNYIGRKEKKRNFRALWIQRINAAVREHGVTYSRPIWRSTSPLRSRLWWIRRLRPKQTSPEIRRAFAPAGQSHPEFA